MADNSLKVGAGVGLIAGAGAGFVKGTKKAAEIMKPFLGADGKASVDTYVASRLKANETNIMDNFKGKRITEAFKRVAEKAKADFEPALAKAKDLAKNTKIKSVALFALAGTAIGVGIAAIANKIKASKNQNA